MIQFYLPFIFIFNKMGEKMFCSCVLLSRRVLHVYEQYSRIHWKLPVNLHVCK